MSTNSKDHPSNVHALARLSYAQDLMAHRRVLVLGDQLSLIKFASESRARWVTAVAQSDSSEWSGDTNGAAIERVVMPFDNLRFRDGAYDLAIVPDLSEFNDPTPSLTELRRIIGPRGHCVVATPNPVCDTGLGSVQPGHGLDYYEAYDQLAAVFPSVQMIGQSPFVGYAVADLSFEDPNLPIRFDGGLLGEEAEEIEWFLAVCGEQETEISPYSVIQIPLTEIEVGGASKEALEAAEEDAKALRIEKDRIEADHRAIETALAAERAELQRLSQESSEMDSLREELEDAKLEMGNRGVRIGSLEQELEEELKQSEAARARGVQLAKELDNERKAAQKKQLEEEFARRTGNIELQSQLKEAGVKLRQAEERARSAEAAHDGMVDQMRADAQEIDTLRVRFEKAVEQYKRAKDHEKSIQDALLAAKHDSQRAEERAHAAESKVATIEEELAAFEGKEFASPEELKAFGKENERLEQQLKNNAALLAESEIELARREAIVRDLVVELEKAGPVTDQASEARDDLKSEISKRESQIESLTEQLDDRENEIAALWGAKAGQHRARVEAELALATYEDQTKRMEREWKRLAANKDAELDHLADIADAKSASVDMLRQELVRSENALQRTQDENQSLTQQRDQSKEALEAAVADAMNRSDTHAERDKHIAKLEAELQAARWKAQEAEARNRDLDTESTRAARESEDRCQLLRSDVEQTRLELASMKSQLNAKESERETAVLKRETLERDLKDVAGKLSALEDELARTRAQTQELSQASDTVGTLQRQLDDERNLSSTLRESLKTTEAKLIESEHQKSEFKNRCVALEEADAFAGKRITDMEQKFAAEERSFRMVEEEAASRKTKVTELGDKLHQTEQRRLELEDLLSRDATERAAMETELASLRIQLESASAPHSANGEDHRNLTSRAEEAETRLEAMNDELAGARMQLETLERKNRKLETNLSQEIAAEMNEVAKDSARVFALEEQLTEEQSRVHEVLTQNETLVAAMQALQNEMASESDRTRLAGADAARVAGEAADLRDKLNRKDAELREREEENWANDRALSAFREEVAQLSDKFNHVRDALLEEQNKSRALAGNHSNIESETQSAGKQNEDAAKLEAEIQELRDQVRLENTRTQDVLKNLEQATQTNETLQHDVAVLRDKLQQAVEDAGRFKYDMDNASVDLENLQGRLLATQNENKQLINQRMDLEKELVKLERQLQSVDTQRETLQSELTSSRSQIESQASELNKSDESRETLERVSSELEEAKASLSRAERDREQQTGPSDEEMEALKKANEEKEAEFATLMGHNREQSSLLESLTSQLEEREIRATSLERQVKELTVQIGEHESDIAAWEMELKFRNSRISQLEQENESLKATSEGN